MTGLVRCPLVLVATILISVSTASPGQFTELTDVAIPELSTLEPSVARQLG